MYAYVNVYALVYMCVYIYIYIYMYVCVCIHIWCRRKHETSLFVNLIKYRTIELLIYWAIDLLDYWPIELLSHWAIELLSFWAFDLLTYWAIKLASTEHRAPSTGPAPSTGLQVSGGQPHLIPQIPLGPFKLSLVRGNMCIHAYEYQYKCKYHYEYVYVIWNLHIMLITGRHARRPKGASGHC